jgi:hypothetical protein
MVRIPLCCICCGGVDGGMDGCSGEEIQAESSRLHVLVATVVVMNFEPWRDNDYNFVEGREALPVVCTALLLHRLTDDDLRSSDWLPVKPFSKPVRPSYLQRMVGLCHTMSLKLDPICIR